MARLRGFPPAGSARPRILILGSFPSAKSLEKGEYYAHDRNHFWSLLGLILGFEPGTPYLERITRLERAGIALWDLLASCEREGSLDQDIRDGEPNALAPYLESNPAIARVALNGGKAAVAFARGPGRGAGALPIGRAVLWHPAFSPPRGILVARLPSSSPVPSRDYRTAADKLPAWSGFLSG